MADSLTNQAISSTYQQLLHLPDGCTASDQSVRDGDGTATALKISNSSVDVSTHDGSSNGLKLNNTLLTATASELNQLDEKTVGGGSSADIPTNSSTATFTNKTIDGGTY